MDDVDTESKDGPRRSRRRLTRIGGIVSILLLAVVGHMWIAQPSQAFTQFNALAFADQYMNESMDSFQAHRANHPRLPRFNWVSDGCRGGGVDVPDSEFGFNFRPACERHDWGYANYGQDGSLDRTEDRRKRIDDRFFSDMNAECNSQWWNPFQNWCRATALTYYTGVRNGGGSGFHRY
jgi:hypothetical protein